MEPDIKTIKGEIKKIYKQHLDINECIRYVVQAKKICEEYNCNDLTELNSILIELNNNKLNEYNTYLEKLAEIRKNCDHDMKYIGHDSHHDYYKCSKCGYKEKY